MVQKINIGMSFFEKYASDSRVFEPRTDWEPVLYSCLNGGYNIYHKDHNFCKQGNGGYAEKLVGMILAVVNGKKVLFLPEKAREGKHPDFSFDGMTWDVKFINEANVETIRKYIKNGRKADNIIFYWSPGFNKLEDLKEAAKRSIFSARKMGVDIPGIYYMYNLTGLRALFLKKRSEPSSKGGSDLGAEGVGVSA